jgi:hypothetical protein
MALGITVPHCLTILLLAVTVRSRSGALLAIIMDVMILPHKNRAILSKVSPYIPLFLLDFIDPGVPTESTLNVLFPVQESSNANTNFQLSITLNCNPTKFLMGFLLKNVVTNIASNLTTISLVGYAPSGKNFVNYDSLIYFSLCPANSMLCRCYRKLKLLQPLSLPAIEHGLQ